MPEVDNLKGGKIYFGSQHQRFLKMSEVSCVVFRPVARKHIMGETWLGELLPPGSREGTVVKDKLSVIWLPSVGSTSQRFFHLTIVS